VIGENSNQLGSGEDERQREHSSAINRRPSFAARAFSTDERDSSLSKPRKTQKLSPFLFPGPLSKNKKKAEYGDELRIVTAPSWDLGAATPMAWGADHLWSAELEGGWLPESQELEFKLVLARADGSVEWEQGPNRVLRAAAAAAPSRSPLRVSWGVAEALGPPVRSGGEGEGEEAAAPGASAASPAPEPAAVASSGGAVLEAMGQFVKSVSSPLSPSPSPSSPAWEEEEAEEEEASAEEAEAPAAAAAALVAESEPATGKAAARTGSVQGAAAAAALGVGGALLATALAVDLADAALLGVAAAAVAAATGSSAGGGSNPAAAAASRAARAALEAPERLLRAAGMKSFAEREAEAAAAAAAREETGEDEEE
jgi:hypothetical protein